MSSVLVSLQGTKHFNKQLHRDRIDHVCMFACAGLRGSSKKHAVAVRRAARVMPVVQCKKVAVLGAAGGIGQPLSLLLKMNKCVTELALFDVAPIVKGVAVDLSHCNTPVQVGQLH